MTDSFSSIVGALVVSWSVVTFGLPSAAAENPFGLPEGNGDGKLGSVMLHGGGRGLDDNNIREEFLRLAGGQKARIVFLPSDEEQWDDKKFKSFEEYEERLYSYKAYGRWADLCKTNGAEFNFAHRKSPDDKKRFLELLKNATGVWLPTHDAEWLTEIFAPDLDPLRPSQLQTALREVVARGGVVGGLGGGMAALPESMITGDAPDQSSGDPTRPELKFGVGLLTGVLVDQNFDRWTGRLERLTYALRNAPKLNRVIRRPGIEQRTIGIGVDRYTAAILTGPTVRVMGEGKVDLFIKSNGDRTITWHRLKAGDDPLTLAISSQTAGAVAPADGDKRPSPFGAPEPSQPGKFGTVVLHGGNSTAEMPELMARLSGTLRPALVHCPSAEPTYGRMTIDELNQSDLVPYWTTKSLRQLKFINATDPASANQESFVSLLKGADAVWFMGGEQETLNRLYVNSISPTRFQEEVRNVVRRGGVVAGSSAGCAAMSDVMIEKTLNSSGSEPAVAKLSRGLGVLSNVVAEQHFDARAKRIERFSHVMRDQMQIGNLVPHARPKNMIGIAVEEDTALIVRHDRVRVVGSKTAHIFLKGRLRDTIVWHALEAGDIGYVTVDEFGSHRLMFEEWEAQK